MDTAEKVTGLAGVLARNDDRFAFFVALLVLGGLVVLGGIFALRYLVQQNAELVSALTNSHTAFQDELKAIVERSNKVLADNAVIHASVAEHVRDGADALRQAKTAIEVFRQNQH